METTLQAVKGNRNEQQRREQFVVIPHFAVSLTYGQ